MSKAAFIYFFVLEQAVSTKNIHMLVTGNQSSETKQYNKTKSMI